MLAGNYLETRSNIGERKKETIHLIYLYLFILYYLFLNLYCKTEIESEISFSPINSGMFL